ncbi:hypothetical protein Mkiyose1088_51630 [Mycobacterium kiyosense]|uniref:Uncharacterized protein n=1 Tax=Mycobacterium kiyosense TaxID=2871094 RepID=A0A9P3QAE2_9MYCO|nr:hypothetical protein SRL2020028_27730 [Mycobacterium kiyosense]GLB91389.1 hypothetical protein SRL2020130_42060 [Mycobacterium kiyosense]GLC10390.1 hypothetical protein SRL2020411_50360 [Mycobacterium kiyosense]GLC16425.1 hypothetical protein SRL2020448_50280 [Mycobacterium kiyosense]GLD03297.1 hypothetical protein Mkiyose1088_51630 [Mycobacterium kiyosense]
MHEHRTPRVFKAAAWVAIVAGITFVVSVIFFTGFRLGLMAGHGGGHHHGHHHKHAMMHHGGFPGSGFRGGGSPEVGPGGPGGAGGPGGPAQVPSSVSPSATPSPAPGR